LAELFSYVTQLAPDKAYGHFNLACALSLLGNEEASVRELRKALELDRTWTEPLLKDPDLDNARNGSAYRELVAWLGAAPAQGTGEVQALWAKSLMAGSGAVYAVATDGSGSIYVAGGVLGSGAFSFGNNVGVPGTSAGGRAVLVKYNSSGVAEWAGSVTAGSGGSQFSSVAVDGSGSVYAAGQINGTGSFTFGNAVRAAGLSTRENPVLVKYSASGVAQWARTVTAGTMDAQFDCVTTDSSGNAFAAGTMDARGTFSFGNKVTGAGSSSGNINALIVKYDASGVAQWAKAMLEESNHRFSSVATDRSGNVYAAGDVDGFGQHNQRDMALVKLDPSGVVQWTRIVKGPDESAFDSVASDTAGNVYAAGHISSGEYIFGNNVVAAKWLGSVQGVLVKYNAAGVAQWATSVRGTGNESGFAAVATDNAGKVYAAGNIYGTGSFIFGTGVSVTGVFAAGSVVLVAYDGSGAALWARSVTDSSGRSTFGAVAADNSGSVYAAGTIAGSGTYFGNGVGIAGARPNGMDVLVRYGAAGVAR
jgi:hypothetical protein